MEPVIVDEFEDEMIFPTGYEEDYDIVKILLNQIKLSILDDSLNNNIQIMIDQAQQLFYLLLLHHHQLLELSTAIINLIRN